MTLSGVYYIIRVKFTLRVKRKRHLKVKNRIEEIRNSKGIKQDELGKMLGVSRQTISSLENGRYNPSIMLAYKIAKLFDMTIEEVFIFEEELV